MNDNTLVQYKGGGYDGCIWEWNFACKYDGQFLDVGSSGRNGCHSEQEMDEYIEEAQTSRYLKYFEFSIPDQLEEFFYGANEGHAVHVARVLHREFGIEFNAQCYECETILPAHELIPSGYQGAGGIAIVATSVICKKCREKEIYGDYDDDV